MYDNIMNTEFLKIFLTIVSEGNLSKAADKLFMTQPTLSRQLAEMEEHLGVKLFERGKRQMLLTEAGYIFERKAKEILELIDQTELELKQNPHQLVGEIRIGSGEFNASTLLAHLIEQFNLLYPTVTFVLYTGNGDDIKEKLDSNLLDCGILLEPIEVAKYQTKHIPVKERWGIVLPSDHPLAIKGEIDGVDILNLPLFGSRRSIILNEIASWLEVDIHDLHLVLQHNLLSNSLLLAQRDVGYPITVEGAYKMREINGLSFIPLTPLRTTSHVFAYRKNINFTPVVSTFINFVLNEIDNYPFNE